MKLLNVGMIGLKLKVYLISDMSWFLLCIDGWDDLGKCFVLIRQVKS